MSDIDRKYLTFSASLPCSDDDLRMIETRTTARFAREGYVLESETIERGEDMATVRRVYADTNHRLKRGQNG